MMALKAYTREDVLKRIGGLSRGSMTVTAENFEILAPLQEYGFIEIADTIDGPSAYLTETALLTMLDAAALKRAEEEIRPAPRSEAKEMG